MEGRAEREGERWQHDEPAPSCYQFFRCQIGTKLSHKPDTSTGLQNY
jgi:hypothetical protein